MKPRSCYYLLALLSTSMLTPFAASAQQNSDQNAPPVERDIEEVVVRGAYIPEPKRETSQVSTFVTREDFELTGDDDVAASIRRSTGVTLSRGKFVYVRGLGERFSSVVLNGLELPSPEPLRRVAPLDIFPTEVLEGITVQKTFSPQYNADFGGGMIDLETRPVPAERIFSLKAEVGLDTQSTFRNGVLSAGGDLDFLGFDDGIRSLSDPLKAAFLSGKRINSSNFTSQELQEIGRSMPNAEFNVLFEGKVPADYELGVTYGVPFELFGADSGLFFNAGFTSEWDTKRGKRQTAVADADPTVAVVELDGDLFGTQHDTRWHTLSTLGLDWGDHILQFTNLYIKTTTKENRTIEGFNRSKSRDVRQDSTEWIDRELFVLQARGTHFFANDDLEVKWNFGYSDSSRDAPFERSIGYESDNTGRLVLDTTGGVNNQTRFSIIEDEVFAATLEGRYNFRFSDMFDGALYAGYDFSDTDRLSAVRQLSFQGFVPIELRSRRADFIFSDVNINPSRLQIQEVSGLFDNAYVGSLEIHGFYAGAAVNLGQFVNIDAGVRVEDGEQIVDTFSVFEVNEGAETLIDGTDVLPSASINWTFAENMQLRGAYSETIGRPQFRELAFSEFRNVETDQLFFGNPFLENPSIKNFDLRWEWYFARNQFLTVGGFYKNITDPIEEVVQRLGGGDTVQTTFQQIPKARLWGVEVEFTRRFEIDGEALGMRNFFKTKEFMLAANYTFTDSEIVVNDGDVVVRAQRKDQPLLVDATRVLVDGRPLQGQVDHIFNIQFGFEDFEARSQFTIMYNFTSERIRELGENQLPNILARDPASLDIRYTKEFTFSGQDFKLALTGRNLLGDDFRAVQGEGEDKIFIDTFNVGRSFSLSATAQF